MYRHGENIYHRKDGRWEARFPIGKRVNGTTNFKSVFGKTYSEAKARRCQVLAEWLKEHPPIHDECVMEKPVGVGSVEGACAIMGQTPEWCRDLPLRADGYECRSYRKS